MHCLSYLLFMLHNEETTLLQQEVHLERNPQRALCSICLLSQTMALSFQTEPGLHCHIYGSQKIISHVYYNNI